MIPDTVSTPLSVIVSISISMPDWLLVVSTSKSITPADPVLSVASASIVSWSAAANTKATSSAAV